MTVTTLARTRLASPAVFREHLPDSVELVLTGRVTNARGEGIGEAVLEVCGVRLRVDDTGGFELLLETALTRSGLLWATVTAPGYTPAQVALRMGSHRLADGTPVVLRDFALQAEAA
jgi:hypothetical protein